MTQIAGKLQSYADGYLALTQGSNEQVPGWLRELRSAGWSKFQHLGFPTARRGNERWKYTNVRPLAAAQFSMPLELDPNSALDVRKLMGLAPWHDDWINLVFVDGIFSLDLSTGPSDGCGAVIGSLATHMPGNRVVQELSLIRI